MGVQTHALALDGRDTLLSTTEPGQSLTEAVTYIRVIFHSRFARKPAYKTYKPTCALRALSRADLSTLHDAGRACRDQIEHIRDLGWTVLTISIESPRQPDVEALLNEGDAFALTLYPAENYYGLDLDALEQPGVALFVARDGGAIVGTAALVEGVDATAELKRMFVSPSARGLGVAGALLGAVEARARLLGVARLQLETGEPQAAAIALYLKHGFAHVPQFGKYVGDPTSVCMEKVLA